MNDDTAKFEPFYMRMAVELAERSRPSPNPQVGAVIVANGEVVGIGHHERAGESHAEVVALLEAGPKAQGADLYVTLEPCCHQGRTGPCSAAVASAGIARVAVGMVDPDIKVRGAGIQTLKDLGIQVEVGIEQAKCENLLASYSHHRQTGLPWVTLKAAMSLDGHLATTSGDSKWISSFDSRKIAHEMRSKNDAILVGIDTVIADDPMLDVRLSDGRSPVRVVMDSHLRIPLDSKLVSTAHEVPLWVAYTKETTDKVRELKRRAGITLLQCEKDEAGRIHPHGLLQKLGNKGILSLLVEGGSQIHGAFLAHKLVQRVVLFVAPKVFGSGKSWSSFGSLNIVADAIEFENLECTKVGGDLMIDATPKKK